MYATQPFAKDRFISKREYYSFLVSVFNVFKEIDKVLDIKWIIKSHPRDDLRFYKKILKKVDLNVEFIKKPSPICINELGELKLDLVIVGFSTFGIEIIFLKKMLLGLMSYSMKEKFPSVSFYEEYGVPIYTERNLNDFKNEILEFTRNRRKRKEKIAHQEKLIRKNGIWLTQDSLDTFLKFLNNLIDKK